MSHDLDTMAARLLYDREVNPELLEEWTAQVAAPKPTRARGTVAALLLRSGAEWLALPASCLDEAAGPSPIHAVPYLSSPVFLGLINMGGELLPCMSLAALLRATPSELPAHPRVVAVSLAQGRFALLADEVAGTATYHPGEVRPAPDTVARSPRPLVRGVVELEGRPAGLLDATALGEALFRSLRP